MKTIRHNTYETNSSSTHSITVINLKDDLKVNRKELVYADNVLYPNNLQDSEAYISLDRGEGGYIVKCYDAYHKAALTIHYLNTAEEYVKYETDYDVEKYKKFKTDAVALIKSRLELDDIVDAEHAGTFNVWCEYERCPILYIFAKDDWMAEFDKYMTDIVLNPEIVIIDEDQPY